MQNRQKRIDKGENIIKELVQERGLHVVGGFTIKVKETLGNERGCSQLTSLIISMGPPAFQGYWAAYGLEKEKKAEGYCCQKHRQHLLPLERAWTSRIRALGSGKD
jgi:hypothetical protein